MRTVFQALNIAAVRFVTIPISWRRDRLHFVEKRWTPFRGEEIDSISWRRDRLHFVEKRWSAMVMLLFVNHNNNSLIVRRKKKSIQNNSKNKIKSRAHGAEDYHE